MIAAGGDEATADFFHDRLTSRVRRLPGNLKTNALRKLDVWNAAHQRGDLRSPPGNRLETVSGNLAGYYSIRVNDQWRICFRWAAGAFDVELVAYH